MATKQSRLCKSKAKNGEQDAVGQPGKRRWAGCTVVAIASGPSLHLDDLESVRIWQAESPEKRRVIAVNATGSLAPWADVLYGCDEGFWSVYGPTMPRGPERWTANELAARAYGINFVASRDEPGLSEPPSVINQGGNSGYQAIGLAYAWGAARVILLGYDMQRTGGKSHWHGDHKGGLPNLGPALATWPAKFEAIQRQWPHVVNATRETALTCFPRASLADALIDPPEALMPLLVHGMHGMGDNLHQRAVLRELMKTREVWLETPWPSIYHDLVGPRLHLVTKGSTLRTQAKNAAREAAAYAASPRCPVGTEELRISYPPDVIRANRDNGGVLAAMSQVCGVPVGDFRLPVPGEWVKLLGAPDAIKNIASESYNPWAGRPIIIFRPLMERSEWSGCRNRNPDPTTYLDVLARARAALPDAFVISIADLEPGKEWLVGPQPDVDLTLHAGELDFQGVAALWSVASLVISSPGFGIVLAQAVETPCIVVFGGYEGSYSFDAGARVTPTHTVGRGCDCFSHTHQCRRSDDGIEGVDGFVNKHIIGPK